MISPTELILREKGSREPDGIGGFTEKWEDKKSVYGYIDLVNGTDRNNIQNAFTEQSTHIGIIPMYDEAIKQGMRLNDPSTGRWYHIDYVDDPMNLHHHQELYMTYGGG